MWTNAVLQAVSWKFLPLSHPGLQPPSIVPGSSIPGCIFRDYGPIHETTDIQMAGDPSQKMHVEAIHNKTASSRRYRSECHAMLTNKQLVEIFGLAKLVEPHLRCILHQPAHLPTRNVCRDRDEPEASNIATSSSKLSSYSRSSSSPSSRSRSLHTRIPESPVDRRSSSPTGYPLWSVESDEYSRMRSAMSLKSGYLSPCPGLETLHRVVA
nr:hypothetical protein CFP56_03253 [Quercus suber]